MNERITIISLFNVKNLKKINNVLSSINISLCKVPFGKNIINREDVDTLPWHFTLSAGDITKENLAKESLKNIKFNEFVISINKLEVLPGKENSYVLVFNIMPNKELTLLHKKIYEILPTNKYNPDNFIFHITIHISKDYEEIMNLKKEIERNFQPFKLVIDKIGLFRIYPASLVAEYYCIKNI